MISRSRYTALLDANVLVPIRLTDILVQLATYDLFQAKWTLDFHYKWMKSVRKIYPDISQESLESRRDQMDAKTRDALVTAYEPLIGSLSLPDENDRHVLASATISHCDVIVTYNLKDFPKDKVGKYAIETQHPDAFLANHLDLYPGRFCAAVRKIMSRHITRKVTVDQYLDSLAEIELVTTAASLREYSHILV